MDWARCRPSAPVRVKTDAALATTVDTSAAVLMIVASAALFAWVLTANQVAEGTAGGLLAMTDDKTLVLLLLVFVPDIALWFPELVFGD